MEDEICFYDNFTVDSLGDGDDYAAPSFQAMSIDNSSIKYDMDLPSESASGSQSGRSRGTNTKQQRGMPKVGSQRSGITQDNSSSIFHL
jgi:hypothetical protein